MNIGDKMPTFSVADQNGNVVTDQQLLGKKTIIYFYPKDSTPGCTAEACNLRDNYERMLAEGYQVLGVSKDSQKSHLNFIAKYHLHYYLILVQKCYKHLVHGARRKCAVRHVLAPYARPLCLMKKAY